MTEQATFTRSPLTVKDQANVTRQDALAATILLCEVEGHLLSCDGADPDAVVVQVLEPGPQGGIFLELRVADSDIGHVMGKRSEPRRCSDHKGSSIEVSDDTPNGKLPCGCESQKKADERRRINRIRRVMYDTGYAWSNKKDRAYVRFTFPQSQRDN